VNPVTEEDATAYNFHESFTSLASAPQFVFQPAAVPRASRNLNPPADSTGT
jgi:hypothetical protein